MQTATTSITIEDILRSLDIDNEHALCETITATPIQALTLTEPEEDAFKRALGLKGEWQQFAKRPRSNQEIETMASRTMTLSGSSYGTDIISESHQNNPPRIWLHTTECHDQPCFQETRLVAMIRRIYEIHQPAEEGQIPLVYK